MSHEGIFATTAEVVRKAGANASAVAVVEAYVNDFIAQAESTINSICRYNFSDNYATLNADTRNILKEAASNIAAMYIINYDMSGFTSRVEAETMLDVLRDGALRATSLLRDKKVQDFINGS